MTPYNPVRFEYISDIHLIIPEGQLLLHRAIPMRDHDVE